MRGPMGGSDRGGVDRVGGGVTRAGRGGAESGEGVCMCGVTAPNVRGMGKQHLWRAGGKDSKTIPHTLAIRSYHRRRTLYSLNSIVMLLFVSVPIAFK